MAEAAHNPENTSATPPPEVVTPLPDVVATHPDLGGGEAQRPDHSTEPEVVARKTIDTDDPHLTLEDVATSTDAPPTEPDADTAPDTAEQVPSTTDTDTPDADSTPEPAASDSKTDEADTAPPEPTATDEEADSAATPDTEDDADATADPETTDPVATPEPDETAEPEEVLDEAETEARAEKIQKQRLKDTEKVASSILLGLTNEKHITDPKRKLAARAIKQSDQLGNLTAKELKKIKKENGGLTLPKKAGTPDGEPLQLKVGDKMATVVEIDEVVDDTSLKCYVIYPDDPDRRFGVTLSRKEIVQANTIAEKKTILDGLDGAQQAVVGKYLDHIDPTVTEDPVLDADYAKQLEAAVSEKGMITGANIQKAIENHYRGEDDMPEVAKQFIASLEGKTLIDKDDMKNALAVMGVSRFGLKQKVKAIEAEYVALGNRTDPIAQQRRQELDAQFQAFQQADAIWAHHEKQGSTPYDAYLDKLVDGQVEPEQAKAMIEAFETGDTDRLVESLPNLTAEEKKKMGKILRGAGKGGFWILLAALVGAGAGVLWAAGTGAGIVGHSLKAQH